MAGWDELPLVSTQRGRRPCSDAVGAVDSLLLPLGQRGSGFELVRSGEHIAVGATTVVGDGEAGAARLVRSGPGQRVPGAKEAQSHLQAMLTNALSVTANGRWGWGARGRVLLWLVLTRGK